MSQTGDVMQSREFGRWSWKKQGRVKKKRNKKNWGFVFSAQIALCAKMMTCLMLMHANVLHKCHHKWIFTFLLETDFESINLPLLESFSKLRWKEETCLHQQNKNVWVFFFFFLNLSKAVMERSTLWVCRGENTSVFFCITTCKCGKIPIVKLF